MKNNSIAKEMGLKSINNEEMIVMAKVFSGDLEEKIETMKTIDEMLEIHRASSIINGIQNKKGRRNHFQKSLTQAIGDVIAPKKEKIKVKGTKGMYGFLLNGTHDPIEVKENELLRMAKIYGFTPDMVKKIISKPAPFHLSKGDYSMMKF